MDIQKAKYHVGKIQTILDQKSSHLSALDRDVMLNEIRSLYDAILHNPNSISVSEKSQSAEFITYKPTSKPVAETEESFEDSDFSSGRNQNDYAEITKHSETTEGSSAISEQSAFVINQPKTDFVEETFEGFESVHLKTETLEEISGAVRPETNKPFEAEEEIEVLISADLSDPEKDYSSLFEFKSAGDLSDKLGNAKIEHLNNSMSINDKILFINHLFGGEAIPFQESLHKFESFYTFEEAKSYAARELVESYKWAEKDKQSIVRQFMQLIHRLYI